MPRFTTRVMLHDADWSEYETLHIEMAARGFFRTITDDQTGLSYELPWAEYNYIGEASRQQVLSWAQVAAAATGRRAAMLVTESAGRLWSGLDPV